MWHDGSDWLQRSRRDGYVKVIDPVRQVRQARYALRSFVESDPGWTQARPRWNHVVVFPNSDVSQGFALSDCPRWMVIDRNDTMQIGEKLRAVALDQKTDLPLLTATAVEQLTRALAGRGLPQRDVVARALENDDAADILTDRQAVILDAIRLLNRVEVRGGAGSGKTFMATEQARRLAAAGRRVALVCYSHGLASYLKRITGTWKQRQRPTTSGSSTISASSGAHPRDPTNPSAPPRPRSSSNTTCPPRWSTWRPACPTATGSTRSSSTRPRTSPTVGGSRY